jgi:tetratricopeptide (TPR) repeat protein
LEIALRILQQEEALYMEVGDKDGLSRSWGNQAVILEGWGQLEEAMTMFKKVEALCLELGNKDGLEVIYGNQALILKAWGRLEEAFELHKKQEALCLEMGDKSSPAYCYFAWGLLAREQRDRKTEREKLAAALDIFTELNMPRERDAVRAIRARFWPWR